MQNKPWHYDTKGNLKPEHEDEDKIVFPSQKAVRRARRTFERSTTKQNRPAAVDRMVYERATQPSAPEIFAAAHAAKYSR